MKRSTLIAFSFCLFWLNACTPPTQRPAQVALQKGLEGEATIISDFSLLTYQTSLDKAAAKAKANPEQVPQILETMSHEYQQVAALCVRHERNVQLMTVTKLFVESQKGILNLMIDDTAKANEAAKAKGK